MDDFLNISRNAWKYDAWISQWILLAVVTYRILAKSRGGNVIDKEQKKSSTVLAEKSDRQKPARLYTSKISPQGVFNVALESKTYG